MEEEPIENTLRRFKKVVSQSGHLQELRFKEFWENAHDKKKRQRERNQVLNKIERTNDRYDKQKDGEGEYNS
jgi:ribosomal protein S21